LYALNTDFKALKRIQGLTNVYLLGKKILRGAGSGGDPTIGKLSVEEATQDIRSVLENTDILFIVAGLGKGTGSGASPEIAKIARQLGILTVAIVNFPSVNAEGRNVYENALNSFNVLKSEVNTITKISNDKIINNDKNISYAQAFEQANIEVTNVVNDIVDMIDSASSMNLDFADVSNFFKSHKTFMAGTFALNGEYSYDNLKSAITQSVKKSYSDMTFEVDNMKLVLNLKINTKIPSSVTNDIRNIFKELTNNHTLSLVHGVDYVNIEGLKGSYLITANDQGQTLPEENNTVTKEELENFVAQESNVYKTTDFISLESFGEEQTQKTGGVKRETIKFDTQDIILESERFNSRDVNKLMTKAINSVMNKDYEINSHTKKYN
jgi:cell division protein FtsZ